FKGRRRFPSELESGWGFAVAVRWAVRCKDAGSVRSRRLRARPRTRQRAVQRGATTQASFRFELSVPGRRVIHPAAAEHRRDDVHVAELLRLALERVAVEHDEVGEEAGQELAAPALVAREPRGIDGRRFEGLL